MTTRPRRPRRAASRPVPSADDHPGPPLEHPVRHPADGDHLQDGQPALHQRGASRTAAARPSAGFSFSGFSSSRSGVIWKPGLRHARRHPRRQQQPEPRQPAPPPACDHAPARTVPAPPSASGRSRRTDTSAGRCGRSRACPSPIDRPNDISPMTAASSTTAPTSSCAERDLPLLAGLLPPPRAGVFRFRFRIDVFFGHALTPSGTAGACRPCRPMAIASAADHLRQQEQPAEQHDEHLEREPDRVHVQLRRGAGHDGQRHRQQEQAQGERAGERAAPSRRRDASPSSIGFASRQHRPAERQLAERARGRPAGRRGARRRSRNSSPPAVSNGSSSARRSRRRSGRSPGPRSTRSAG